MVKKVPHNQHYVVDETAEKESPKQLKFNAFALFRQTENVYTKDIFSFPYFQQGLQL